MRIKEQWEVDPELDEGGYHVRSVKPDGSGESIAFVYPPAKRARRLAELIAMAPEMERTLEVALKFVEGHRYGGLAGLHQRISLVLAAVKGKSGGKGEANANNN